MTSHEAFGRRDRAVALAALGGAALGRLAFAPLAQDDPQPLEMQILVVVALQDSLLADPPHRTGTQWISLALRLDGDVVAQIIRRLARAGLVHRPNDPHIRDEISWELDEDEHEDEDLIASELPIEVTPRGFEIIGRWIGRARPHFGGWPGEPADVDDAVG